MAINQTGIVAEDAVDLPMEPVFLGLRMVEGIHLADFRNRFGEALFGKYPKLQNHIGDGLLELVEGRLKTTPRGALLLGVVERDLV